MMIFVMLIDNRYFFYIVWIFVYVVFNLIICLFFIVDVVYIKGGVGWD